MQKKKTNCSRFCKGSCLQAEMTAYFSGQRMCIRGQVIALCDGTDMVKVCEESLVLFLSRNEGRQRCDLCSSHALSDRMSHDLVSWVLPPRDDSPILQVQLKALVI